MLMLVVNLVLIISGNLAYRNKVFKDLPTFEVGLGLY